MSHFDWCKLYKRKKNKPQRTEAMLKQSSKVFGSARKIKFDNMLV